VSLNRFPTYEAADARFRRPVDLQGRACRRVRRGRERYAHIGIDPAQQAGLFDADPGPEYFVKYQRRLARRRFDPPGRGRRRHERPPPGFERRIRACACGCQHVCTDSQAEEIAQALSFIRLDRRPIEPTFVERIYNQGSSGIRDVASLLANEVARSGDQQRWQRDDLLARLYRNLLGRQGDTRQIAADDPAGFANNLRLLDREGYEKLVLSLVGSAEFRQVHDLDAFDDLPANPDLQRRPVLRDTRPNG